MWMNVFKTHQLAIGIGGVLTLLIGLTLMGFVFTQPDEPSEYLNVEASILDLKVGEEYALPVNTSFDWDELTWMASDPSAIKVEGDKVHALAEGTYSLKVLAPDNGPEAILHVHVEPAPIDVTLQGNTYRFASPVETKTLSVDVPESMVFDGFYLDEALSVPWEETLIESSVRLFPKFTPVKEASPTYTVTLIGDTLAGETFQIAPQTTVDAFLDAIELDAFLLETDGMTCLHVVEPSRVITEDVTFKVGDPASHPCTIRESDFDILGDLIVGNTLTVETPKASLNFDAHFNVGSLELEGSTLLLDDPMVGQDVQLTLQAKTPYDGTVTIDLGTVQPTTTLSESEAASETLFTITIVNETGTALASKALPKDTFIEDNMTWAAAHYVGYVKEGNTCETLVTSLPAVTASITWVAVTHDHRTPCIALDSMVISGDFKVGETLNVHVLPRDATVTYQWFISEDNQFFEPLFNETGASIKLIPEYHRQYLAVNVSGEGDFTGLLKAGTRRIELNTQFVARQIIIDDERYIPLATRADLEAIDSEASHVFARGTAYEMTAQGGLDQRYALINDIDLGTETWTPLGDDTHAFSGKLNGQGFAIRNLTINSHIKAGLFNTLRNASIKSVVFENFNIDSNQPSGALAAIGYEKLTINDVLVTAVSITGNDYVGGLIGGLLEEASVGSVILQLEAVSVSGEISGDEYVGGLIGHINEGVNDVTIKQSINLANIIGQKRGNGGFIGFVSHRNIIFIKDSKNAGNITSNDVAVGGFIGAFNGLYASLDNLVNVGDVRGSNRVGGIFGFFRKGDSDSRLVSSYSIGVVSLTSDDENAVFGGLIGEKAGEITVEESYYLSGTAVRAVGNTVNSITPYALEVNDFISLNQFINNWDIAEKGSDAANTSTWIIEDGLTFPYLSWIEKPLDIQRVNHYYIPLATREDLEAIDSNNNHVFAMGTEYELVTQGGLDKSYILIDDIDLGRSAWAPIGDDSNAFSGSLFGNGYTLSNLTITPDDPNQRYGFFAELSGATIENLIIKDAYLSTSIRSNLRGLGTLAGSNTGDGTLINNLVITNAYLNAPSIRSVALIVGDVTATGINIISTRVSGEVIGEQFVGGFIGGRRGGISGQTLSIDNSANYADVYATSDTFAAAGGMIGGIGFALNVDISDSYNMGNVTSSGYSIGGFVGEATRAYLSISNAFNFGNLSADNGVGGLIGNIQSSYTRASITNSYSAGIITSSGTNVGALVGFGDALNITYSNITHSFYLSGTAQRAIGTSSASITGFALEPEAFFDIQTFESIWNITESSLGADSSFKWNMKDGETMPYLSWQKMPEGIQFKDHFYIQILDYIPIATREDLASIDATSTQRIFSENTVYETSLITPSLSANYILVSNIDLNGEDWVPLASSNPFTGILFGNDKTISDMTVSNVYGGLFDTVKGAKIQSVIFDGGQISGAENGIISAYSLFATKPTLIEDVQVIDVSIQGGSIAGGLIGLNFSDTIIRNTKIEANIEGGEIGGVIGRNESSGMNERNESIDNSVNIFQSSFNGTMTGIDDTSIGGFIGFDNGSNTSSAILESFARFTVGLKGSTSEGFNIGGFVGTIFDDHDMAISDSYAHITIQSDELTTNEHNEDAFGGFIGYMAESTTLNISYSYIHAEFDKVVSPGGIIGNVESDTDAKPIINLYNVYTNVSQISEKTTSYSVTGTMGDLNTAAFSGWYTTIWNTHQTLPYLNWEDTT